MGKKSRRGSSMGKGTRTSRKNRKLGRAWLNMPKGVSLYKEEPGTTIKIDILPYIVKDVKRHPESEAMGEDVWYRFPYKIHKNVGPNRVSVICPTTIGKACPLCEEMQAIYDDPDADNKQASKFRPSKRSLFYIKVLDDENKKNKGKEFIWDMSDFCFFDQVDTELEFGEEEWNDFACLEGGYSLKVRLLEETFTFENNAKNAFAKADRIDFVSRADYDEDILDNIPCLDDVIVPNIKTVEEIEAIMEGEEPEEEEKKEKETKKKTKKEKKPKFKWEDISNLDEDELIEFAEKNVKDFDEEDFEDEDELREYLAKEFKIEIPEDETEEEEEEPAIEDEPEPEEEEPKKKKKGKKETKKKKVSTECPYAYKFGIDFAEKDECVDPEDEPDDCCEMYDKCFEAYENNQDE